MDFPDGSTYTINSKALALVSEEENGAANAASEHRHAQKRAKAQASSKEKEDAADLKSAKKRAAPWGANTNEAAKKKLTRASACQVRSEGIPLARTSRAQAANLHSAIHNILCGYPCFEQAASSGGRTSEYKGVYPHRGNWVSKIWVSPSSLECTNRDICLM